jgi:hypothetical protein
LCVVDQIDIVGQESLDGHFSYEVAILIFIALLFLVILFSYLYFHKVFCQFRDSNSVTSMTWIPILARRKSSVYQSTNTMQAWDLELSNSAYESNFRNSYFERPPSLILHSDVTGRQADFRTVIDSVLATRCETIESVMKTSASERATHTQPDLIQTKLFDLVLEQMKVYVKQKAIFPQK